MKKNMDVALQEKKVKKIFLIAVIVCIVIVLIEGCLFFYIRHKQEQKMVYYDAYQMVAVDGDSFVAVGSSDFKKSKNNPYTKGIEKGKLIKYDKDGKVDFEVQYDKGIASTFTSVLVVDDGYLVTGSGEYDEYQTENKLRDAFLIKYDKSGKKVWEKFYGVLSNTRFNKAIQVSDGYVVIGQSIYENMEVGNHITGGGIIVKYDFDGNEVWHNNHGGNKSGNFNGIVEVDGEFYVAGKDGKDSGNLVKFDKNGKYVWHKNFSYTDAVGLQDVAYFNNHLYVVGSKKILKDEKDEERKTENTDGIILKYDKKGKLKDTITFGGSKFERFSAIQVIDNHLYILGTGNSTDSKLDIKLKETEEAIGSGFVLEYDKDLKLLNSKVLGGMNNDVLTEMTLNKDKLYISGYSNSKDSNISTSKNNGKDYFGKVILMDKDFNIDVVE